MDNVNLLGNVVNTLLANAKKDDYAGFDPFDHLNSRLFQKLPFRGNRFARLVWIQLGKRSPINLRDLTGVPKLRNPKGVGLFILGLINLYKYTKDLSYLEEANQLGEWLLTQTCDQSIWKHPCWGYHFDWEAKAFSVPKGKPNIITTLYVSKALYELGKVRNDDVYRSTALKSAKFMYHSLFQSDSSKIYFSYIPGESAVVFNASLWGAAWCVKAGIELSDEQLVKAGIDASKFAISTQNSDGSWLYGMMPHHKFIDGFHTAYNLEALKEISEIYHDDEITRSIESGLNYFINTFIQSNGAVKYYSNSFYPEDTHNNAQALITLIKFGKGQSDLACKVSDYMFNHLYIETSGTFIYQRYKNYTNYINYIRWTQGWAFYSLTSYLLNLKNE